MAKTKFNINRDLFKETSHSPALVDIVGEDMVDQIIDFCFIANPYYPTEEMLDDLLAKFSAMIKAYPSSNPGLARQNLADVLQTNADFLVLGNGATELINIIEKQLIDDLAIPIPTFSEYIEKLKNTGSAKLFQLDPKLNYQLDLKEYADWINDNQINSALIINPGNPTGQLMQLDELKWFLKEMSHLKMIILDESFIDFADEQIPSLIPEITAFDNLIIVRSMSKHCGVPGLRLGYCCASNQTFLKKIKDYLPIWNINSMAEYFLLQLKRTNDIYHETRLRVIREVRDLEHQLQQIPGYKVYPTGSNFILLKIEFGMTATELQFSLLENKGLYVRDCSNKAGLDNYHIRVSSQGREKDLYLVDGLRELATTNPVSHFHK
ncbi:MAG TPA: histidinol-phosphate transaminase [Sunxiuqinia sp.]|nr:histidinol-phosphate transaminase [Sunxiuqinia sp.]